MHNITRYRRWLMAFVGLVALTLGVTSLQATCWPKPCTSCCAVCFFYDADGGCYNPDRQQCCTDCILGVGVASVVDREEECPWW